MLNEQDARNVIGTDAYSSDGDKIGKVGQLFLDDQSGEPEFVTVNTGLFGTNESFVPVAEATVDGDRLTVPFTKDKVKDAPNVHLDSGHLNQDEEQRLFDYYGMGHSHDRGDAEMPATGRRTDVDATDSYDEMSATGRDRRTDAGDEMSATGRDRRTDAGDEMSATGRDRRTDRDAARSTDDAMTRSEEQLQVGKTEQEAGRARLRKYVVTEQETVTVPVRKEKAVLDREPITEGNVDAATAGSAITEEEHEVVLHEERPVVDKHVEAVERVHLGTETTTEEQTVSDEVRKERIEVEGDIDDRR